MNASGRHHAQRECSSAAPAPAPAVPEATRDHSHRASDAMSRASRFHAATAVYSCRLSSRTVTGWRMTAHQHPLQRYQRPYFRMALPLTLALGAVTLTTTMDRSLVDDTEREVHAMLAHYDDPVLTQYTTATIITDTHTIIRYLLATGLHPVKAAQSLVSTMLWRLENDIDTMTVKTVEAKLREDNGTMFVSDGRARDGSAVIYNRKSTHAETDHDAQLKLIIYTLERAIESMRDRDNDQWIWVIDLQHWTKSSGTSLSESKRVVDVLRHHYVERLNHAIIVNAPYSFHWLFALLQHVLPQRTRSKVSFVSGDATSTVATLTRFIDASQIEKSFGGSNDSIQFELERYIATDPLLSRAIAR